MNLMLFDPNRCLMWFFIMFKFVRWMASWLAAGYVLFSSFSSARKRPNPNVRFRFDIITLL
jgi:hypothetical protein